MKYIQILGERWSGTNYLASLINLNFPCVELTKRFGGKHWFIRDHFPRCEPNNSTDFQCVRPLEESDDTLFLVIVRNPFDWLRSMRLNPYHAQGHHGLSFSDFIRKSWLSFETNRVNPNWPESPNGYYFIESAENIVSLRAMKLLHWLALGARVKNIAYLNYEHLRDNLGYLKQVSDKYGIKSLHPELKNESRYCCAGVVTQEMYAPRKYKSIDRKDLDFIDSFLDWSVEGRFGYSPGDYSINGYINKEDSSITASSGIFQP